MIIYLRSFIVGVILASLDSVDVERAIRVYLLIKSIYTLL